MTEEEKGNKNDNKSIINQYFRIQENWLGSCTGTSLDLPLVNAPSDVVLGDNSVEVWTDKPELVFGLGFVGLAGGGHILDRPDLVEKGEVASFVRTYSI